MDCLFCKIIAGEIPSHKIYEDEHTLAFLDINQDVWGHSLVVPKRHFENTFDMPEAEIKHIVRTTKKIATHLKNNVGVDGINLLNNSGEHAGQIVHHFHLHIFPRFKGDGFKEDGAEGIKKDKTLAALGAHLTELKMNSVPIVRDIVEIREKLSIR